MGYETQTEIKYQGTEEHAGFTFQFEPVDGTITIEKTTNGFVGRYLVRDEDAQNPDEYGDDGLFLVGYHRDFTVDRERRRYNKETGQREVIDAGIPLELAQCIARSGKYEDGSTNDEAKEYIKKYHIFPLEAYIHSGVVLHMSGEARIDRAWDVSQLGMVFVSKKEWRTRKRAEKAARGLIETWNSYLSGDVYGIVRENYNKDKQRIDGDECWGFYGHEYAIEALKTDI